MKEKLERKAKKEGIDHIEYIQGEIGQGSLPEASYDRAYLVSVLGEVVDKDKAFAEIFKTLKPAGILTVGETIFDPHYQNKEMVKRLAKDTGFHLIRYKKDRWSYLILLEKPKED